MKYLSGSDKSPFDEGCKMNLIYVFHNKKFREKDEKYINWKKRVLNKYQIKGNLELKNI